MRDKSTTTKTVETDKGLTGTTQKETTQTETDANRDTGNAGNNPNTTAPNQEGQDLNGGGRVSG